MGRLGLAVIRHGAPVEGIHSGTTTCQQMVPNNPSSHVCASICPLHVHLSQAGRSSAGYAPLKPAPGSMQQPEATPCLTGCQTGEMGNNIVSEAALWSRSASGGT